MNPTVSVIVPVYNTEAYLEKCISTILSQTYSDFEIILVDDGSQDNSFKLCKEFELRDTRIHAYTKENGGLSSSRNFGIERAIGDFLVFLDSDDWFDENMLEILINGAKEYNTDVVIQGFVLDFENEGYSSNNIFADDAFFDSENIPNGIAYAEKNGLLNSSCNKLYKKSLFKDNNIKFQLGAEPAEDLLFNCRYFTKVTSFLCLKYAGYHYVKRGAQTLTVKYMPNYEQKLRIFHEARQSLYEAVEMPKETQNVLLGNCNASYILTAISNIYRKTSLLKFSSRTNILKYIYAQQDLMESMLNSEYENTFIRLIKLCAKTKNAVITNIVFTVLFFCRYRFANIYAHIRKKVLYGEEKK